MAFFYTWGGVIGPVIAGAIYDRSRELCRDPMGNLWPASTRRVLTALLIKPWNAAHEKVSARYEA